MNRVIRLIGLIMMFSPVYAKAWLRHSNIKVSLPGSIASACFSNTRVKHTHFPVPSNSVSVVCSTHEMQGRREYMEDRIVTGYENRLACAFDGHGGDGVAKLLHEFYEPLLRKKYLPDLSLPYNNEEVMDGLKAAMLDIDNLILPIKRFHTVGAAFTTSFVHTTGEIPAIITVNAGDSRIVLSQGKKAVDLTVDHKPSNKNEKARIVALGGTVKNIGCPRVNGILALSRSVGDRYLRPYVTSEPEIQVHEITEEDEFVIVATDGIWDDFTSQQAVDFIHQTKADVDYTMKNPEAYRRIKEQFPEYTNDEDIKRKLITELLCHTAIKKGSEDNISVIIQWLSHTKQQEQQQ